MPAPDEKNYAEVEAALRASEARFKAMNDASPLGVFVTDKNGDCTYTNRAYHRIVGYSFEDLLGKGWSQAVHPEDRDRIFNEWYQSTLKTPFHFDSQYRNLHPDGHTIWLNVKAAEMRDDNAEYGYVGTIEDITEFKRTQSDLMESERKYRHLVEDSVDIIFSLDAQGRILTVSSAVEEHLGLKPEALINTSFLNLVYSESGRSDHYASISEHIHSVSAEGGIVEFTADFTAHINEPYELNVRLERIIVEDSVLIYGKATRASEDVLLKHCVSEEQEYEIGNNFRMAAALSLRLTARFSFFNDEMGLMDLKLGVREILVNAIEHGNLNITFEEKARAIEAGIFMNLIQERQQDSACRDKKVFVNYVFNNKYVEFIIMDEGAGFDFEKMMMADIRAPERSQIMHGRGIALARELFDEFEYYGKGNRVRLRKYLS